MFGEHGDAVVGQTRGVLDAVDPGSGQRDQRRFGEAVRGDAGAVGMRRGDGFDEHVGGPTRLQITGVPVDPVPDELDPAVPPCRLSGHLGHQPFGLDLLGEVAKVAAGARNVPPRADELRQVLPLVDPARVSG